MTSMALPVLSSESGLASYMDKINKFPYLTQEEEYNLAKKLYEEGDIEAAHKLVTSHLRLVVKIANGFRGYGLPMLEIISEGNIGLMQAVKKFDPEKGFRLSTYAIWWIKASIQEYVLKSWSLVKIGTTAAQKKLFFNLRRMKNRLDKLDNNALSPEEVKMIATELEVGESDVIEMDLRLSASDKSLNSPILSSDEDSGELIDMVASDADNHEIILVENDDMRHKRSLFSRALKALNPREREIIVARRLKETPETLDNLSKVYNISCERVRQIENRAMEKLQQSVAS